MLSKLEIHDRLMEWLSWRQTMKSLRQDAGVMETTAHLKLGMGYGLVLRELAEKAAEREKTSLAMMQQAGIHVLGAKEDNGETFVWWKQRGRPDLYRIGEKKLQPASQLKLDELLRE